MKLIQTAIFLTMMLVLSSLTMAADYVVSQQAGDFKVVVTLDKNPPVVGKNMATVSVTDQAGKAVADIKVRVDYSMPAMPGMPAMSYQSNAFLDGTTFTAPVDFSMSGAWNVAVKILREGKTSSVKFNVDVQ